MMSTCQLGLKPASQGAGFYAASPLRQLWSGCLLAILALARPGLAQDQSLPDALAVVSALEQATTTAIAKAERSVVAIARIKQNQAPGARAALDPLGIGTPIPIQSLPNDPDFIPAFYGSGVIISQDGFIVTCAHVLDDPRQHDYYVWLDKRTYSAKVVAKPAKVFASDPFSDLAVLKIDAENLTPIQFGNTDEIRKGKFVLALGNPEATARDGLASVSWGIISNLSRVAPSEPSADPVPNKETVHQYGTLIQTDAKLNFGTSGGALLNLKGEMIGLTTALAAQTGYEQSAGFAIPTDKLFQRVIRTLQSGKLPEYGFLGIQPEDLLPLDVNRGLRGARVSVVIPGLPGDKAGLRSDDVIIQVADKPIHNRNDLFRELSLVAAGEEIPLLVHRYQPGTRTPRLLRLPAQLSKKFVATQRPAFALNAPPKWRGMDVEYATAVISEQTRGGLLSGRSNGPTVAVLAVEPGTPAWNAGIRPGYGIREVNQQSVETPDQFRELVGELSGPVSITVIRAGARTQVLTIPETKVD